MASQEYDRLLSGEQAPAPPAYQEYRDEPEEPVSTNQEVAPVTDGLSEQEVAREQAQKKRVLEKIEEDKSEQEQNSQRKTSCPVDYWGVRSYLHNFYEMHFYKDPTLYEDEEDEHYLLSPNPRRKRCKSIWWKVFVWIGANFLIFGILGVLIGYLVPEHPVKVAAANNIEVYDTDALRFNYNLDICKLVGLILFCTGGIILTVSLLFPSFLYHLCEEDRRLDGAFKVSMFTDEKPMKHPLEASIPVTSKLSNVQPTRKGEEAMVTQEGMVVYKD